VVNIRLEGNASKAALLEAITLSAPDVQAVWI